MLCVFFFFKQKTAYEMRISDWSSDVCSSDLERGLAPPRIETFDPVPQFGKRHDAQVKLLFVDRGEPVHHAGIGTRLCPFGNDIGIEQEAHSAVSRTPPSSRSTVSPEPRSGEARRKSAKLDRKSTRLNSS